MKHQIITIGKEVSSVYHAIKEFKPDFLHFLITKEVSEQHLKVLDTLQENIQWKAYMIDAYDGASVIKQCRRIHEDIASMPQEGETDITYNLSEGTKIMSMAAFCVAKEKGVKAIYLTQTGEVVDLMTFKLSALSTTIDNTELLNLSGNRLWTYISVHQLPESAVQTSYAIKDFIERYRSDYSKIQNYFRYQARRQITNLPSTFDAGDGLKVTIQRGRVKIFKKHRPLLSLSHHNSVYLFFGGRWWEALVGSQVKKWVNLKGKGTEAWQSVVFQSTNNNDKVKNEIDVLINNNNSLIFLECKSGHIFQEDIYKINSVKNTYGGEISTAALASYYPLEPLIKEKCEDLGIHYFAPESDNQRHSFINTLPQWLNKVSDCIEL